MLTQKEIDIACKCDLKDREWRCNYAAALGISLEAYAEFEEFTRSYYLKSQGVLPTFADWKLWKAMNGEKAA